MKVIVHIGRPKTGTTGLQQFLYANRQALSDAGYLLFDGVGRPNNVDIPAYFSRNFPVGLKPWRWRRGIYDEADREAFFGQHRVRDIVEQQVEGGRKEHHTAIITSEHLASSLSDHEDVSQFRDWVHSVFTSARVLVFVRPQVELAVSSWSTSIRSGGHRRLRTFLKDFVNRPELNYLNIADRWTRAFGLDEVDFHLYQSTPHWDVREFFASHYLQGAKGLKFRPQRVNSSYGRRQANLIRQVNRIVPFWLPGHTAPNPRNLALRLLISRWTATRDRPITLTPVDCQRISRQFEHPNAEFSRVFLTNGETL